MNKKQFLNELASSLKHLPASDRKDILQDFEEHFAIRMAEGKTEEEIAASLGSPQQIGKEMTAAYHVGKVEEKATTGNILRAVFAAVSLGFFNVVIVLGPFIGLASLLIAGWLFGLFGLFSPVFVLLNPLFVPGTFEWFDLFFSILISGVSIFVLLGMYYVTNWLTNVFVKYLRWNVDLVKGGLKNV